MSLASDTFRSFVDALAADLDDHALHGADLASRVYLSRWHFDRLVSATGGHAVAAPSVQPPIWRA
jgi:AraC family transcriptional regulator